MSSSSSSSSSYQRLSGDDNNDEEIIHYYQSSTNDGLLLEANVEGAIPNDNVTNSYIDGRIYVKNSDAHSFLLASQLAEDSGLRPPVVQGGTEYSYGLMVFSCLVISLCTVFVIIYFALYYNT